MYIGIITLNTLENTVYIKLPVTSGVKGLSMIREVANKCYKGKVVDYSVLNTDDLDTI